MIRRAALVLALIAAAPPVPGPGDPHVQSARYDPDGVIALRGAPGWQIAVELPPAEKIETVVLGDANLWQAQPSKRGDRLYLRPLTRSGETNLTVETSARRYAFALSTGAKSPFTPWVVRIDVPRPVLMAAPEPPPPPEPKRNFAYDVRGDAGIAPEKVWDDGHQTYFAWKPGAPIPAVFAGAGREQTLVNVVTRGRVSIVQQLAARFTVRLGRRQVTVLAR